MVGYSSELERIKRLLKTHPRGLSTIEISRNLKLNRNTASKYLEILLLTGDIEMKKVCSARIYYLSRNVPIKNMLSLTGDLIVVIDGDMSVKYANRNFLAFEECELSEISGKTLSDLIFHLISQDLLRRIENYSGRDELSEIISVTKGDKELIFSLKAVKTVLQNGTSGVTLIFEDVTENYDCRKRLDRIEELYRAVTEDFDGYIVRYTPEKIITYANNAYCHAFAMKDSEGSVLSPDIPKDYLGKVIGVLSGINPDNPVLTVKNPVRMPSGDQAWHRWTVRGIFDEFNNVAEFQSVGYDV